MKAVIIVLLLFTTVLTFLVTTRADGDRIAVVPAGEDKAYCIGNRCFAVFHSASVVEEAQRRCAETPGGGGHLMTVRTAVSRDALLVLLPPSQQQQQQYWVGLVLQGGCPEAAAKRRGFTWWGEEEEEGESDPDDDDTNWAAAFDGSCASTCVAVSPVDGFKWRQRPCDAVAAGFLCEYSFVEPCERVMEVEGQITSVNYSIISYGFEGGGEDFPSLPPGSTATLHPSEAKYICASGRWMKAPWACEIYDGGCEHRCVQEDHHGEAEPVCFCPPGQVVNPGNNVTCEVAPEDHPCPHCSQWCSRLSDADTYTCKCDHGFQLAEDGSTCRDIDECSDERQCPEDNYKCKNTVGGFQCACRDGYKAVGVDDNCVDINECASAPCEHMCDNTPGGYECSCFEGYIAIPDTPNRCALHCGRVECPAECDPNDRFQCYCPHGYIAEERGNDMFCIDINECEMYTCDQDCENTYGGFVCSCSAGFTLVSGYRCEKNEEDKDTDEDKDPTDRWEGSGVTTPYPPVTPSVKYTEPTAEPSTITAGGLLGIIVCVVLVILVMVFLAHLILKWRGTFESGSGALKAPGDEGHNLEHVTSGDKCEQHTSSDIH